jgi:hypothetical protein
MAKSIAIAPRQGNVGSRKVGGHIEAFRVLRAKGNFAPAQKLEVLATSNPWRVGTPGAAFFDKVLAKKPATVKAALELADKAGIANAQGHLAWLFTWGPHLKVDGKLHAAPVASAPAKAPRKASKVAAKVAAE